MNTHDLRMKYTEEFLAKGTKVSSADEALGIKAVDYLALAPKVDANQAYQMCIRDSRTAERRNESCSLPYHCRRHSSGSGRWLCRLQCVKSLWRCV